MKTNLNKLRLLLLTLIIIPSFVMAQAKNSNLTVTESMTILEHRSSNNSNNSTMGVDQSTWLHYDDAENIDTWGFLINGEIYDVAAKWDPADLSAYDGWLITKIKFIVVTDNPIFKVKVWEGPNATEIYSQDVNSIIENDWTEVILDTPVVIDASTELWAGYYVDYTASELGGYVTATDNGPPVDEYGNLYKWNGTWYSDFNNHNLRVYIELNFDADFEADNTTICAGGTVNYTPLSSNVTSWAWTFEGGTPATSTAQNPSVIYNSTGTYDVTLIASDGTYYDTLEVANMITVDETPVQPDTPSGPIDVCGNEEHIYTTFNVPMAESYIWEVNPSDAGEISGSDTSAIFESALGWSGTYTIKVKATNDCGASTWSTELSCNLNFTSNQYYISAGGGYCSGGQGIEVTLDGSDTEADYELYLDGISTGTIINGTGSVISFGYQTTEGIYTATGFSPDCSIVMFGDTYIYLISLPTAGSQPSGPEEVCANTTTDYQTTAIPDADTLIWTLSPVEAGEIIGSGGNISIHWFDDFSGMAYLSVYGTNDCGDGSPSDDLEITVSEQPTPEVMGETVVCKNDQQNYSTEETTGSTFVWEVQGGDIIAGTTTNEIIVVWPTVGSGFVLVTEISSIECEGISDTLNILIDECIGIGEKLNAGIKIYPNPARDFINIDFDSDDQKKCELIIYNQFGQRINKYYSVLGGGESHRINIETLTPGIYFINVITSSGETLKQKLEVVN